MYNTHFAGMHAALQGSSLIDFTMYDAPYRFYASNLGRWHSPDPIGEKAVRLDDPQTWNMYAYVRNNPTTLNDPTGLQGVLSSSQAEIRQEAVCQGSSNGNSCPAAGGGDVNDMQPSPASAAAAVTLTQTLEEPGTGVLAELPVAVGYGGLIGLVIGEADNLIANITDTLVENYKGEEQQAAIGSVVMVENARKLSHAKSDETAGGGSGAKQDNTLQGKIDRLKGPQDYNKAQAKKGGYRVGTGKSEQELDHALGKIKSLSDAEKAAEE
jgi:RHS repeat-associated protein